MRKMIKYLGAALAGLAAVLTAGCTASRYAASASPYYDNMYGTHDRQAIAQAERRQAEIEQAEAEARRAGIEADAGTGRRRGRHHIGGNRRRLFGQLHRRLPRRIRKCLLAAAEHVRRPVLCPSVQLLRLLLRHGFLRGRRLRPGVLRHLHRGRECHRQSRLSHAVELLEQPLLLESRFLFRKLLLALLGMELGLQLGMELGMGPELGMVSGLVASGMA